MSVMVRGTLERILDPDRLEELFKTHAVLQYTRTITFAQCVQIMDAVVFKTQPSVSAWYREHRDILNAGRSCMYEKLNRMEPQVAAALVRYSGRELRASMDLMKAVAARALAGPAYARAGRQSSDRHRTSP